MSIINTQAVENARNVMSGKDAKLCNSNGKLLASMETYHSQANFSNTKYQPLGSLQEFEVNTGFGVTLSFTEIVVEDDEFVEDIFEYMDNGTVPEWNLQGVLCRRDGSEERMVYNNCIPSGNIDLQNVSSGDVIKRAWSLYCNAAPKLQGKLS
ncbi:MAG: hypothetical protein LUG99_00465 [Lachnospiraceae bacterium]|nr:hypothetical protein [Lachnospiraceae bacterium]